MCRRSAHSQVCKVYGKRCGFDEGRFARHIRPRQKQQGNRLLQLHIVGYRLAQEWVIESFCFQASRFFHELGERPSELLLRLSQSQSP